jgi:hypothetical protein
MFHSRVAPSLELREVADPLGEPAVKKSICRPAQHCAGRSDRREKARQFRELASDG